MGNIITPACEIEYIYDNAIVYQEASINKDGDVEPRGELHLHKVSDTYVWCETHQKVIHSGEEHFGLTLNEDWQAV